MFHVEHTLETQIHHIFLYTSNILDHIVTSLKYYKAFISQRLLKESYKRVKLLFVEGIRIDFSVKEKQQKDQKENIIQNKL